MHGSCANDAIRDIVDLSDVIDHFFDRIIAWQESAGRGKGSHGRLYYGDRFTTLKDRRKEIGPGLLSAMLDQLGLTKDDLEE